MNPNFPDGLLNNSIRSEMFHQAQAWIFGRAASFRGANVTKRRG